VLRHIQHAEDLVEHRHDDGATADTEQAGEQTGDNAARDDHRGEVGQLADGDAADHSLFQNGRRDAPAYAAAMCARSAPESITSASASVSTSTPAPGFTASVARWRRKARAPGTPRNRPSI